MELATHILAASVAFAEQPFVVPLQISSGTITEITQATASVTVRAGEREATGEGTVYLSDLWAWPDPALTHGQRDGVLRDTCTAIARRLWELCGGEPAHPLELGLRLHESVCGAPPGPPGPPPLARSMCASPFDAAMHDAVGLAGGRSAFSFYGRRCRMPSADGVLDGDACSAIAAMLRDEPLRRLPAWLLVSNGDDLDRIVRPWVVGRGYRCFKLKILGADAREDAERTAEVYRTARAWGVAAPRLTVDSNEGHANAAAVQEYLEALREIDADALKALEYLEQPTSRDILADRQDWRPVTRLKRVLLDEGLWSLSLLPEVEAQGWSGLALKTCKGHSFALVAAAWAHGRGMPLSLQDLTNPGLALVHAALFAAHVPTINGAELNSPQYTPAANAPWSARLPALFAPTDGWHRLPAGAPAGLGSQWLNDPPRAARGQGRSGGSA